MNILTHWLRTFLPPLPVDDRRLADDLTLRGIAVEGVHEVANGHLFEMDITTNRVDAMNHYGIAREAATIYNLDLASLDTTLPFTAPASHQSPIRVDVPDLCGRFTARILRDVTIAPSTGRVAEYFTALNQKQIWNAVDASNFVLQAMGHPTHAFDLDKIEGSILVRLARPGESLRLLDGTTRTLSHDDLVIADERKAISLAGVMGGWDTMITPQTRNILIESAWFDPASIRRTSRRHLLHTDASHRFERGADFNAAPIANHLVAQLILHTGGTLEGDLIDLISPAIEQQTATRPPIPLSVNEVQRHLGTTLAPEGITSQIVHQYLESLGCRLTPFGPDTFQTHLPSWRLDLEREIDLVEEVARVYGYNRFANTLPTPLPVTPLPRAASEQAIRTRLLALGFSESISSTFASERDATTFFIPVDLPPESSATFPLSVGRTTTDHAAPPRGTIPMENPLSDEARLLRPTLIPGMVSMLAHNLNRDVREVHLFEQGQTFTGSTEAVRESPALSLGLSTATPNSTRLYASHDAPFFELKGAIESLTSLFAPSALTFAPEAPAWLEPGRSATASLAGHPIAYFGELSRPESTRRKLRQPIYLAEVDLAYLYTLPLKHTTARDLSRFQAVERDFSFTFPDTLVWAKIESTLLALNLQNLQSLKPTEIFRDRKGLSVPHAHYALLIRATFQAPDRTLTEDELADSWTRIIHALTTLGGAIRAPEEATHR